MGTATKIGHHVYVVHEEGSDIPCKIGLSNGIYNRRVQLQGGNPRKLVVAGRIECATTKEAMWLESTVHRLLAAKRLQSEWFSVSIQEALDLVERTKAEDEHMGWGGARPGSGRKRPGTPPKLAVDNQTQEQRDFDKYKPKLIIPPGLIESIQANARERRRTRADNPQMNPFQIQHQLHPPGARPPKDMQIAMDSAIGWAANDWAGGGPLGQVFAEGLAFPGYPYLAELAQRPEYRTAVEITSREMTRKWIKFSGKGTAHQQRQSDRKMAEDFGLSDPYPEEREQDENPATSEKQEKISQLEEFLDNLDCKGAYRNLDQNDGYFGRAHLFHEINGNDGSTDEGRQELESDIGIGTGDLSRSKVNKNSPITALRGVEAVWANPTTYNAINPLRADWYKPEVWYVQGMAIHASRLFTQIGRPVPDMLKPAYSFGGLSLSQIMQPYVNIWLETRESIGRLIHAFSVMVLMTDLQTLMQPGGVALMERVNLFNTLRDNNGTFLLNKNTEDFKNVAVPLSGLHELQAQSQEHLCSVIQVPVAVYTGISPTGLNASSEGEIRIFENAVHAHQESRFRQNLTKTINFAQLSLWNEIDPDIVFEFVQLRELTEKEEAELRKLDAETDDLLMNGCQAISPEEVRIRVAGDNNGPHAGINPDDLPEPPQPIPGEGGPGGGGELGKGGAQGGPSGIANAQPGAGSPGEPKPGGRLNVGGHMAYTGVGQDDAIDDAEWNEADHPRGQGGQFGSGGGERIKFASAGAKRGESSGSAKPTAPRQKSIADLTPEERAEWKKRAEAEMAAAEAKHGKMHKNLAEAVGGEKTTERVGFKSIGAKKQAEDASKAEKASVNYRPGTPKKHCGICTMFRQPNQCTAVAGDIAAQDVCDLFERAEVDVAP